MLREAPNHPMGGARLAGSQLPIWPGAPNPRADLDAYHPA